MDSVHKSLHLGIFDDETCIAFRNVAIKILTQYLEKAHSIAVDSASKRSTSVAKAYRIGIDYVKQWGDTQKRSYEAYLQTHYKHLYDLHRYTYVFYVQRMFGQMMKTNAVDVTVVSLAEMFHNFLVRCAEDPEITGFLEEPLVSKTFFVESKIRDTLYDVVLQQNNVRGIMRADVKSMASGVMSVHSDTQSASIIPTITNIHQKTSPAVPAPVLPSATPAPVLPSATPTPSTAAPSVPNLPTPTPTPNSSVPAQATSAAGTAKIDVKSQFTAQHPGGISLPRTSPVARRNSAINIDSLDLPGSEQDFEPEVKRLLGLNSTATITPDDSVTNVARQAAQAKRNRRSLFVPAVN